jgi:hypothetical protein
MNHQRIQKWWQTQIQRSCSHSSQARRIKAWGQIKIRSTENNARRKQIQCPSKLILFYGPLHARPSKIILFYGPLHARPSKLILFYGPLHARPSKLILFYGPLHARELVFHSRDSKAYRCDKRAKIVLLLVSKEGTHRGVIMQFLRFCSCLRAPFRTAPRSECVRTAGLCDFRVLPAHALDRGCRCLGVYSQEPRIARYDVAAFTVCVCICKCMHVCTCLYIRKYI